MPDRPKPEGSARVAAAVMKDPVTVEAVKHAGEEPSPSRIAASEAEQSETRLRTEGQRQTSWRWEGTQMWLALVFCGGFMVGHLTVVGSLSFVLVTQWELLASEAATLAVLVALLATSLGAIASLAAGVVATYFQRTNSHKVGGVEKGHEGR